jgi:hypothetical protein
VTGAEGGPVWRRHPRSTSRAVPEGWLVLAHDAESPVLLSGSAATVWDLLDTPSSLDGIVTAAARAYAGDRSQISTDVESALDSLASIHLAAAGGEDTADPTSP